MFAFIGNIGPWELMIVLLIALVIVGPGKLPEVARGLGKAFSDFKKVTSGVQKDIEEAMRFDEPPPKSIPATEPIFPDVDLVSLNDKAGQEELKTQKESEIETKTVN